MVAPASVLHPYLKHIKSCVALWMIVLNFPVLLKALDSLEIWRTVYCQPGFTNICTDRFEASTAGEYQIVEDDGLQMRNIKYGAGCCRTCKPIHSLRKERLHYIELELRGGLAPDPTADAGYVAPNGTWVPFEGRHLAGRKFTRQLNE
jgi:hypothetical protein